MEIKGIFLARDGTPVFQGLDLTLTEQRIGLIGPNGSGKSSLLRLLKGLLSPDRGTIVAPGPIGFVFQNPEHQLLFPTVMEELCFGLLERGVPEGHAREQAMEWLNRYALQAIAEKSTHELSDGQKQLLCILSVLVDGAQTLLFDESFANLDRRTKNTMMRLMATLPQQVIMATHDLELLNHFDRAIWLQAGRVHMDGPPHAVISAYQDQSL